MGHCQTCCAGIEGDDFIIRPYHDEKGDIYHECHDNKSHQESNPVQSLPEEAIWEQVELTCQRYDKKKSGKLSRDEGLLYIEHWYKEKMGFEAGKYMIKLEFEEMD